MDFEYNITYRKVKNPRLEFKLGKLQVVVPKGRSFDIPAFLLRHKNWIKKHSTEFQVMVQQSQSLLLEPKLFKEFQEEVNNYLKSYSEILNVKPRVVKFKTMRTRWGSCSSLGVITLNLKLRYFPSGLIGYVIFHEMIHLIEKSHGQKFYERLMGAYPNYKILDKQLRSYDYLLHKNTYK